MLKATGIVRRIDDLGRVVIPKELRRVLNIDEGDPLEIYVKDEGEIILKKYEPACVFCGNTQLNTIYMSKRICLGCIDALPKVSGQAKAGG